MTCLRVFVVLYLCAVFVVVECSLPLLFGYCMLCFKCVCGDSILCDDSL